MANPILVTGASAARLYWENARIAYKGRSLCLRHSPSSLASSIVGQGSW